MALDAFLSKFLSTPKGGGIAKKQFPPKFLASFLAAKKLLRQQETAANPHNLARGRQVFLSNFLASEEALLRNRFLAPSERLLRNNIRL